MNWTYTGIECPSDSTPVLCAWRVDATYPGAVGGWSYEVAICTGHPLDWRDPEDMRRSLPPPAYWRTIESPDHLSPLEEYISSLGSADQPSGDL